MRSGWMFSILVVGLSLSGLLWGQQFGHDLVKCEISLPHGPLYTRGATDPVADLVVQLVLTNKSQGEKLTMEEREEADIDLPSVLEDLHKIQSDGLAPIQEYDKKLSQTLTTKKKTVVRKVMPVNKDSLGVTFPEPVLGPQDVVELVVKRLPEGPDAEGKKPVVVQRDMPVTFTDLTDALGTSYLAAGESSPKYLLPAGKFYKALRHGSYTVRAIIRSLGDSQTESKCVESNEEKFQILPLKVVNATLEELKRSWTEIERGHPDFDYLFYQLRKYAPWDEVYYVQRTFYRQIERWEWHRLCTVAPDTKIQFAQVTPTQVAVLAQHFKGDAGLYTVDMSQIDPKVSVKILEVKDGKLPTLKVEGGVVTAE